MDTPNPARIVINSPVVPYTFDGCSNFEHTLDRIQYRFKKGDEVWVYNELKKIWLPGFVLALKRVCDPQAGDTDSSEQDTFITHYKIFIPITDPSAPRPSSTCFVTSESFHPANDISRYTPESGMLKPDTTWMRELLVDEKYYDNMWSIIDIRLDAWNLNLARKSSSVLEDEDM